MARGRGGRGLTRGRGKPVRDYYEGLPSDAEYKRNAHRRAVQQTRRAWLIRLAVVALLAVAIHYLGDDVMRLLRIQTRQTASEVQKVGGGITAGRDRRSGADLVEGE